jgi:hypothetical protein
MTEIRQKTRFRLHKIPQGGVSKFDTPSLCFCGKSKLGSKKEENCGKNATVEFASDQEF